MKTIFIANTPFHNYFCNKIVNHLLDNHDANIEPILITSKPVLFEHNFSSIILIRIPQLIKLLGTFQVLKFIKRQRNNVSFFIPHTNSFTANYLYYSTNNEINFYYEGLLNFYSYKHHFQKKEILLKKIISSILGFKYVFEPTIFPIGENNYKKFYTVLPTETLGNMSKKVEISLRNDISLEPPKSRRLIILGGEPSYLSNDQLNQQFLAFRKLVDTNFSTFEKYYKMHPREELDSYSKFFFDFKKLGWENPIEDIISSINPQVIISYPSSALINLKLMFPHIKLKVIYFKNELKGHKIYSTIVDFYKKIGIELTDIDILI